MIEGNGALYNSERGIGNLVGGFVAIVIGSMVTSMILGEFSEKKSR